MTPLNDELSNEESSFESDAVKDEVEDDADLESVSGPATIVLMRHGKAKQIEGGQADFDRELSDAGKRSLRASLEQMLSPLSAFKGSVAIMSSPAARALQTSVLLLNALEKLGLDVSGDIAVSDALWEQDAYDVREDVSAQQCDLLFVVGHNPCIESMAQQLTGAVIPCATGGMIAIQNSGHDSRLIWFSQGPISRNWKTLSKVEDVLEECSKNIQTRLQAFFDDPDDIETMHKLRVSIRTLRSLIAFVKPWQDVKQNQFLQNELRQIVGHTSRLRELDVFAEQVRESEESSQELIAFCDEAAARERERVSEILRSKSTAKALSKIDKQIRHFEWKKRCLDEGLSPSEFRAHFDEMTGKLGRDIETLRLVDVERTHDVRKKAKRARYSAENFEQLLGEDAVDIAKGMTAHQDNLGAVCDARVNIELVNEFLSQGVPSPVGLELSLLRAQNETFLYTVLRDS